MNETGLSSKLELGIKYEGYMRNSPNGQLKNEGGNEKMKTKCESGNSSNRWRAEGQTSFWRARRRREARPVIKF